MGFAGAELADQVRQRPAHRAPASFGRLAGSRPGRGRSV